MSVYIKKDNKGKKRSDTPTDLRICKFLHEIISEQYNPQKILDPCAGDRRLTNLFDCEVINYEIKEGTDFLKETNKLDCDFCIMNPPFNVGGSGRKLSVEIFMDKVLELVDNNIPILMITPMGFRLNQKINSKRWKKVRDNYPPIKTIISLPIDIFEDTLFHCEIIGFNTDKLQPHYFLNI
tara:strand:- start:582 stop:1124 length:543 start_codon:yes stop_codon:yes gene_type:complete